MTKKKARATPDIKQVDKAIKDLGLMEKEPTTILPKDASEGQRLRYELIKYIVAYRRKADITQAELAEKLGIDKGRMSKLLNYKIDLFSAETLVDFIDKLGFEATITFSDTPKNPRKRAS